MPAAITTVTVPQLGVNDPFATVTEWLVADGASVSLGQPICVLETTKSTFELQCEAAGFLARLVPQGHEVAVSEPIALVGPDRAAVELARAAHTAAAAAGAAGAAAGADGAAAGGVRATEPARALAARLGVDLGLVPGSGILRERDVLAFHESRSAVTAAPRCSRRSTPRGVRS